MIVFYNTIIFIIVFYSWNISMLLLFVSISSQPGHSEGLMLMFHRHHFFLRSARLFPCTLPTIVNCRSDQEANTECINFIYCINFVSHDYIITCKGQIVHLSFASYYLSLSVCIPICSQISIAYICSGLDMLVA